MKSENPLENYIENAVVKFAQSKGCLAYKFTSPSRRSVPDRMFVMPEGKGVFFMELKRAGQKPTPSQQVEIQKIRKQGTLMFVVDNIEAGKNAVNVALGVSPVDLGEY